MGAVLPSSYDYPDHIGQPTSGPTPEPTRLRGLESVLERVIGEMRQVHVGRQGVAGESVYLNI